MPIEEIFKARYAFAYFIRTLFIEINVKKFPFNDVRWCDDDGMHNSNEVTRLTSSFVPHVVPNERIPFV